ncbi:MAG: hypothetical protein R6X18_05170 [Chloroflexota bacterium]
MAGFVFALHASYPGYLNADSAFQLEQAITWRFDDWHSPFVVVVWSMLLKLLPGPVGFVTFNNVLIWSSVAVLALAMRRRIGAWSILIVTVPLFPGLFNYLGNVHVDAMLVAWLMAASCLAYLSRRDGSSKRIRIGILVMANLFIVAAFLTRLNAIFCLVPLLLYANARLALRWNLMLCAALILAMPVLNKIQNKILEVTPSSVADSIKVYNLLALSYYERRNLVPGEWTGPQSREIVNACYSPVQWDTAWTGQCGFIYAELQRQQLWGSSQLTRTWLREIINHPVSYFSVLVATFKRSMFEPNSRAMLFKNPERWMIVDNPPRPSTELAQQYIRSEFNDYVGRPWVYALLSALSIVLLFRTRAIATEEGRFALAILASGLIYLLTYFVFNVSAEYRYFYWTGFATYIGLVVVLATVSTGLHRRVVAQSETSDWALRIPSLAIAALAAALVAFPFHLATERRIVTVTPLDSRPVVVAGIHNASTPKWMRMDFEGQVNPMTWAWGEGGFHSTKAYSPFVIELETLNQDIDVVLATGPGMGTVAVEETGFHRRVDTAADQTGSTTVSLPPQAPAMHDTLPFTVRNVVMALLFFLAFLAIFWKLGLSSPSRKSDDRCVPNAGGQY